MTTHLSTGRRRGAFSRFPMVLLLVGIALHAPFAQPLLTLPDVVVEAGAYDPLLSPAAGRTVISGDDLRDQGVSDVAQALEEVTGAWFQASGASGGQKALSIRGSSTNQVLVLVDGVRVADPSFTVTDFSRLGISIEDIESVTVIRGAASAQYGADAVGGVVLIATKRGADKAGFSLSAGNLSYLPNRAESLVEGQNLAFRAQVPLASGGLLVSGRLERDGGAYPYLDAANAVKYRENAALLGGSGSIAWETAAGEGTFSAGLNLAARDMGVPGTTSWATPNAHQRDGQARATLRYATDYFLSDSVSMQATGYAQHGIYEYKNPDSAEDDLHRGTQGGLDSVWSVLLGGDSAASLGLSARYDRIDSTSVKKTSGEAPERYSLGAFAEPTLKLPRWSISPAIRFDWTSDFDAGISGGLGTVYEVSDTLKASLSAATAYRAPTFYDMYWPTSAWAAGNPALKSEYAYSGDIGLAYERGISGAALRAGATAYARYSRDLIIWQAGSDFIYRPTNIGAALHPGAEFEVSASLGGWSLAATYGYLRSYMLEGSAGSYAISDERRVPQTPLHSGDARISWRAEDGAFSGSLNASYKGERYTNEANSASMPAVFLLGASARLEFTEDWALSAQADNLLNASYESVPGYPMPGFTLRVGLEFSR